MKKTAEICTGSYEDCLTAYRAGASRVELNSALCVGGLTPTTAVLRKVKEETDLWVICMVRPRAGGFFYTPEEKEILMLEARELLEAGADGLAFGFLRADAELDEKSTAEMTELIHSFRAEAVFHRAFDLCRDPEKMMEKLIFSGVDRVLTSGRQAKAWEGREEIRRLQEAFGDRIEILAGSGVNAENARRLMEYTGISQVHSSCRGYRKDAAARTEQVSYAYLPTPHEEEYDIVSEKLVRDFLEAAERDRNSISEEDQLF